MLGDRREGHIEGFRHELQDLPPDEFFRFFNDSPGRSETIVDGTWDFALTVLRPLARRIDQPHTKTVLEIGSGGGRLLYAASRAFGHAIGVDVHDRQDLVEAELRARGADNFELHTGDGRTLPVPDGSVDVVYSAIVFQHMERLDVLTANLREARRVLKPGGLAVLGFGRFVYGRHKWRHTPMLYWLERGLEVVDPRLRGGYHEAANQHVNAINLTLRHGMAVELCARAGLAKVQTIEPVGRLTRRGRQHSLLLKAV